ncbi:MAG: NADPH:quinone oxidoreductase family protein [Pseudomonadota bacterium]
MRTWQINTLGDPWEVLEAADLAPPQPGPGQVRVRVAATDLNFADILQCQGRYQVKLDPPFTPGMTSAGVVTAVGPNAAFAVGDRLVGPTVNGSGGYAEEALLIGELAQPVPADITLEQAAAGYVTHGTAWFALHLRGRLAPGETVLVLAGAGGVGAAAIQLAKAHGCWVAAAAGGPEKTAVCKDLGADLVIDYNSEDLYERVMAATDKRGVDVVYDPVGGDFFNVARRLVAWEGRLLVIGFASGDIPQAPMNHTLVKNYDIVGVHMGGYRGRNNEPLERCYAQLFEWMAADRFEPLVSSKIGFAELPNGLLALSQRGTTGRVLFHPQR